MRKYPEDDLQMAVSKYLDLKGLLWCHIANERRTTLISGKRLKDKGVKSGVPDCMIFESTEYFNGLAIELKIKGSSKASYNQKKWLKSLKDKGWFTAVCYSVDDVIKVVETYLKG